MPPDQSAEPTPWHWLIGLTVAALAIRVVYVLWLHQVGDSLYSDMVQAYGTAISLSDPDHVVSAWDVVKPRGLPTVGGFLLRWIDDEHAALQTWGLLQVLLSTATVPLTWLGARRFLPGRVALVAAALLAFDFIAVGFAGYLMSETYLMFFFALAFACLDPDRPLLCLVAGLALGLGAQFKTQALPLAAVWMAILALSDLPKALRRSPPAKPAVPGRRFGWLLARPRIAAGLLGVGVLAIQIPVSLSLSRVLGHRTLLPPYGGQMFYLAQCEIGVLTMRGPGSVVMTSGSTNANQLKKNWPRVTFDVPVFDSAFYAHKGWECFQRSLPHALAWSGRQVLDLMAGVPGATLDPWPLREDQPRLARFFNCSLAYGLLPLALWGLWRRRRELGAWLGIGGPLVAVWGLAAIFAGNPRFREPYDLFILTGAAIGLTQIWDRLAARYRVESQGVVLGTATLSPAIRPTRREVSWLVASWLAWAIVALHIQGAYDTILGGSDHWSHVGTTALFLDHGFQIWDHPPATYCSQALAPDQGAFLWDGECRSVDVCSRPDHPDSRPLCINWQHLGPQGYPPGLNLVSLPQALLYQHTKLSVRAINALTILEYLAAAHLLFFIMLRMLFPRKESDDLADGVDWEQRKPCLRLGIFALLYLEVIKRCLEGLYDPLPVFALLLGTYLLAKRRPVDAFLALSAAFFLHFRAIWYAPVLALAAFRSLPSAFAAPKRTAPKLGLAAVLLLSFACSLLLIYPWLHGWPANNPFPTESATPWMWNGWYLLIPMGLLFLYLGWGGHWLVLGTMAWQLFVVFLSPQVRPWHALFLLPMLGVARLDRKPGVMLATLLFYLLEAVVIFNAPPLPGQLVSALASTWGPLSF